MSRQHRPHLPGAAYHITTRTQGRVAYFTPEMRWEVLAILCDGFAGTDARLIALGVMPNHLHIVMQQGYTRIGRILLRPLTRVARLVQRVHKTEDHVFGARYHPEAIYDPFYLRNAIMYVHLNPVRAGLCARPEEYQWTSHHLYTGKKVVGWRNEHAGVIPVQAALRLFATSTSVTLSAMRRDYAAGIERRLSSDAALACHTIGRTVSAAERDPVFQYDHCWSRDLAPLFRPPSVITPLIADEITAPRSVPEPREIAREVLAALAPDLSTEQIRGRFGGPRRAAIRRAIVERMHDSGYSGVQIARWLRIDASGVSRAIASARAAAGLRGMRPHVETGHGHG